MLKHIFSGQLQLGLAQAGAAPVAALVVVLLARKRGIHLERETPGCAAARDSADRPP
jgi:hypothetical protein